MQPSSLWFLEKPTSYLVFLGMASNVLMFKSSFQESWGIQTKSVWSITNPNSSPSMYIFFEQSFISVLSSILSSLMGKTQGPSKTDICICHPRQRGNPSDLPDARSQRVGVAGVALPSSLPPPLTSFPALCSQLALQSTFSIHILRDLDFSNPTFLPFFSFRVFIGVQMGKWLSRRCHYPHGF